MPCRRRTAACGVVALVFAGSCLVAFAQFERHELDDLPPISRVPRDGGSALGLCDGRDARALFYETAFHVIVPALEAHGLPARAAWEARARSS